MGSLQTKKFIIKQSLYKLLFAYKFRLAYLKYQKMMISLLEWCSPDSVLMHFQAEHLTLKSDLLQIKLQRFCSSHCSGAVAALIVNTFTGIKLVPFMKLAPPAFTLTLKFFVEVTFKELALVMV
jgi:hypothetical protein